MQDIEFRVGHLCIDTDPALCSPCQERLDRQLAMLPLLYGELEVTRALDQVTASRVRAEIRDTLASWADLIVEGRTVRTPRRTVPALAAFLRCHLEWLAAHPAAEDAAADVEALCGTPAGN